MDNDNIQLPPRPPFLGAPGMDQWLDDLCRAAVRYDRERRAKVAAKPVAHKAMLSLGQNGSWSCYPPSVHRESTIVTICWTDDGRAWIESEANRELARRLRFLILPEAADALDGGER